MVAELSAQITAQIKQAAVMLKSAKSICVLTGAGVSAESGIPTFRDKQTGLWEKFRAEDLASPDAFARDPKLVWSWYQWRRQQVIDKKPNPAHLALAQWQELAAKSGLTFTLITQNVDDLHEQAGSCVHHLHGRLWQNRCNNCQKIVKQSPNPSNNAAQALSDELINCDDCGGILRPDIVWFGEALPEIEWQIAENAAADCDVFINIGTSSLVYPAAGLAQIARQHGAQVIEINPHPTPNTIVNVTIAAPAGRALPKLLKQISAL